MALFYKEKSDFLPSLRCPYCNTGYDIEWNTEYGDPLAGDETTECDECEKTFGFASVRRYETWKTGD